MPLTFDRSEIELSVGDRLRKLAGRIPGREAIRSGPDSITFAELDARSERIAGRLLAVRGPAPEPVGVFLPQGIPGLAAILGIMKAGKSFAILPPMFSAERLDSIWHDLQSPAVLSSAKLRGAAWRRNIDPTLFLDVEDASAGDAPAGLPPVGPETLGAILYTSASTGEPKGVMCNHRMILHTAWQNGDLYRIAPEDRLTHLSAYGFGAATTACLAAILNGAALILPPDETLTLNSLLDFLRRERISILSITSFGLFRQAGPGGRAPEDAPPDLRMVLLGGEDLYRTDIGIFRGLFHRRTALSYRLAGSEAMLMRENRIEAGTSVPEGKIPVGRAVPDKELLLLDEGGSPVPDGQIGEIAIRTRYLASGYWRKEELYRRTFRSDPEHPGEKTYLSGDIGRLLPDGQLEYIGRRDNVVKVRGFSIRLEDVERGLQTIRGIRECIASVLSLPSGDKRLAAYIVWAPGAGLPVEEIRSELSKSLPRFMIPTVFVFPESLPHTATGKIARSELPAPGTIRPPLKTPFVPPATETEKKLCALWSDLLQLDAVGIHDDFFDLGGDSLLALHLALRVESEWNRPIPSDFFSHPTVSVLAAVWAGGGAASKPERSAGEPGGRTRGRRQARKMRLATPIFYGKPRVPRDKRFLTDRTAAFRAFVAVIAARLPYAQGTRFAGWTASQAALRGPFFQPQIDLYRAFLSELGGAPEAPANHLEIYLSGVVLWSRYARRGIKAARGPHFIDQLRRSSSPYWRDLARLIEHGPDDVFRRFFRVSGLEYLERALESQRGVIIVTYHNTANRITMACLPRLLECEPIPTISIMRALYLEKQKPDGAPVSASARNEDRLITDLTLEGKRLLTEGKIIQIVPDNTSDTVGNRPLVIGGKQFHIKTGLAEYALLTGAVLLPQYSTRRLDGTVRMTFTPPIEMPPAGRDRDERVYDIMKQYAAFVDRSWRRAPEAMNWSSISRMLQKNRAAQDPADGAPPSGEESSSGFQFPED